MFGKNLTDLVRGIRANKKNEAKFINTQIQAIKEEVRQSDPMKKAIGIQKLTYLQMMGYDMSWAAFNVVEVMSSEKFAQKRLGYLAASQSFQEDTDVILLTTALIKRDMTSPDMYTAGVALNCLANIVTPDLAQDLAQDILAMLNSSRPYVRKKSVLVLYKIFLKFPGALRVSFPRLKDKLTDDDTSVVSAAVNVICELARLNPEKYLILAPILFKLLTVTSNNWMLIKIVKLMGALTPHEPRLAKKLVDPLSNLINSTPAMSLLYECINTCTIGLYEHIPIIKLCIAKLRLFVQDPDQNLKYLGLCALYNIMQRHPKAVTEHRDLILNCLDDPDITIRLRALDLVEGMVKKKTLQEIVRRLMDQVLAADGGSYREDLIAKIVSICSQGNYQFVRDFEWYISTLVEMTRVRGTQHGVLIASQLLDVAIRVRVVRPFAVVNMVNLILDPRFLTEAPGDNSVAEVLYAAAWVVGEFGAGVLAVDQILRVVEAMVQPRVSALPPHIQAVYIHNTLKLFNMVAQTGANIGAGGSGVAAPTADLLGDAAGSPAPVTEAEINTRLRDLIAIIKDRLPKFMSSDHLEVQERACSVLNLVAAVEGLLLQGEYGVVAELATAFEEAMNPVKAGSQRRVPVPDGLDLDAWINDPPPEPEPEPVAGEYEFNFGADDSDDDDDDEWGREQRISDARVARQKNDYILVDSLTQEAFDVDSIPFEELHLEGEEIVVGKSGRRRRRRHGDGGNNPGGIRIARPARNVEYVVDTTEEGFEDDLVDNAEDAPISTREQLARALDVDLEEPIGAQDMLPVRTHHVVRHDATPAAAAAASTANADAAPAASGGRRRRRRRGGNNASAPAAAAPAVSAQPPAAATRPTGLLTSHGGTPPATQAAEAVVDTFEDDLPELAPTSTAAAATPSPAPAPAAAANGTAAAAPSGGKRRRRRRGGNKPSEGNATGDLLGGQAATSTAASTSTSTAAGGASLEDIMGGGSGGGSGADADIFTEEMCADGNMAFRYYVAPTGDANSVSVVISCANLASTMVTGLEFAVVDSMNMKCTTTDPSTGSVKAGMQLFPGVSDTYTLVFSFKDYAGRQRLRGSVTYTLSTGGDQSTGASLDFALMFPPSVFILPVAVDQAEFAEICGSGEMSNAPKVRFDGPEGMSFPDVAGLIVAKLNLVVIHAIEGAASCYGQSVRGEHLALLVKAAEGGKFVAEVKCSNERLGDAISEQIRELFA